MKKLLVSEMLTGEWSAGTSSLNSVWAASRDEAVALWKRENKGTRVQVLEQKYVDGRWVEEAVGRMGA
jgi:hypothetical protein